MKSRYSLSTTVWLLNSCLLMGGCQTIKDGVGTEDNKNSQIVIDQKKILAVANLEEALNKARKAWQEGKSDLAQTYYIEAYNLEPTNTNVLEEMAELYRRLNKYNLVEVCYRLILEQPKENLPIRERYGLLLVQRNKLPEAEQSLQKVVAANKQSWKAYNGLGVIADIQGKHGLARNYFNQAYALQPNNPEVINNLGYSLYMEGQFPEAREYFLKALTHDPGFKKALYNYALVEARQRHYPEALAEFSKVLSSSEANNDTGYIAMMNGDLSEAEFYLGEAQKLSPQYYQKAYENLHELELKKKTMAE